MSTRLCRFAMPARAAMSPGCPKRWVANRARVRPVTARFVSGVEMVYVYGLISARTGRVPVGNLAVAAEACPCIRHAIDTRVASAV